MRTNSTTNYELPQFVGSDIINPLTDLNGAFQTIDSTMKSNSNKADGNTADILTLSGNVSTIGGKVTALETQNGVEVLNTTKQTLSGAINELDGEINEPATGINAKIGTGTLLTTAQTLIGAINELYGLINNQ